MIDRDVRPLIGITCGRRRSPDGPGPRVRPGRVQVAVNEVVVTHIRAAGGIALLLPPGDVEALAVVAPLLDGVVVTGGAFDIHPSRYGQAVRARFDGGDEDRTDLELAILAWAYAQRVPALGVCGGMQAMAVSRGGSLLQDIATERPGAMEHEQAGDPAGPGHALLVTEATWAGRLPAAVNSTHHQAIDDPGPDLRVIARAPDGIVEAVDHPHHPFYVGVQWHPELLDGQLYRSLVDAARTAKGSPR